ncbi:enoyl-CoA hydratase-related protein [Streptomyces sp. NPDC005708]|uniref:enoyl-CoA hydratase-related protein n=1 Tax=Streptomyces sp. NPDC005708 TaxID=3154564 RepID=UPI0033E54004
MTDCTEIDVDLASGVLWIRLNAPERLNAVTAEMLNGVRDALLEIREGGPVRAVVLTGAGRAFCSGAHLGDTDVGPDGLAEPDPSTLDAATALVDVLTKVPVPVVCGLNGLAAGVGVSLALACDVLVAVKSAYLLLAFTKVGLMPDGGATALVAASLGRSRALRMGLLAERLPIEEAAAAGLVWQVVEDAPELDAQVSALATRLAEGPTRALGNTKCAVNAASLPDFASSLQRERDGQMDLMRTSDYAEGVSAFLEHRKAKFQG